MEHRYKYFMYQLFRPEVSTVEQKPQRNLKKNKGGKKKHDKSYHHQDSTSRKSPLIESASSSASALSSSLSSTSSALTMNGGNGVISANDGQAALTSNVSVSNGHSTAGSSGTAGVTVPTPSASTGSGILRKTTGADERGERAQGDPQNNVVEEGGERMASSSRPEPYPSVKVTHLCSKFNIVCAAYEDGSIACWKCVFVSLCSLPPLHSLFFLLSCVHLACLTHFHVVQVREHGPRLARNVCRASMPAYR